jgi:hypothetical protein
MDDTMHCSAAARVVRVDDDAGIEEPTGKVVQPCGNRVPGIVGPAESRCDSEHTTSVVEVRRLFLNFDQMAVCLSKQFLLTDAPLMTYQVGKDEGALPGRYGDRVEQPCGLRSAVCVPPLDGPDHIQQNAGVYK